MIRLLHPSGLSEAEKWKAELEEMAVPFRFEVTENKQPVLMEGSRKIEGVASIERFFIEYKTFLSSWNQDRCDMWFFDEPG